jgi:hypothetical protein
MINIKLIIKSVKDLFEDIKKSFTNVVVNITNTTQKIKSKLFKPTPLNIARIETKMRKAIRKQLSSKGFRITPRVVRIINRYYILKKEYEKTLSINVYHKSSLNNETLNNYPGHTVKESTVLKILTRGRPSIYSIPSQNNNSAKVLKFKGIFYNWRRRGRIQVPQYATLLSDVSGGDPYGVDSAILRTLQNEIKTNLKLNINVKV